MSLSAVSDILVFRVFSEAERIETAWLWLHPIPLQKSAVCAGCGWCGVQTKGMPHNY